MYNLFEKRAHVKPRRHPKSPSMGGLSQISLHITVDVSAMKLLAFLPVALVAIIAEGAQVSWPEVPASRWLSSNSTSAPKSSPGGSFEAPVATNATQATTSSPKISTGGSFEAPVASSDAKSEPVLKHYTDTVMEDDDDNTTTKNDPFAHHVYSDDEVHNSTSFIRPEGDQPEHWPHIVIILFLAATIVLCALTARKSFSRRRHYQEVPTTLLV